MIYPNLYKRATDGKIVVWCAETDDNSYRTHSGDHGGKFVTTLWTVCEGKNVGKKNETSGAAQATKEVEAMYKKRLKLAYTYDINDVDNEDFYFAPMLAKNYDDYIPDFSVPTYSQPKFDGIRCIAKPNGLFTRKGEAITTMAHIVESLNRFREAHPDVILDGELYNHELRDNLNKIASAVRKEGGDEEQQKMRESLFYYVYDYYDEQRSFSERHQRFANSFAKFFEGTKIVPVITHHAGNQADLDVFNEMYLDDGYEGQIVRTSGPGYENKRTKHLLKRKSWVDEEFEVVDILPGTGNRANVASSVVYRVTGVEEDPSAGIIGDMDFCRELLQNKINYIGGDVTIKFFKKSEYGVPMYAKAKAFYPGKRDM